MKPSLEILIIGKGRNMHFFWAAGLTVLAACIGATAASAQDVKIETDAFDLERARQYEFREVAGRPALCLDGVALLRGAAIRDGSVTVDIATSLDRQFGGIAFRARDGANYEEAYLRLHKSRQPDAVQYAPVMNGEGQWQLFGTQQMPADFGSYDWVTLQVDFALDRATVRVSGAADAEFRVNDLALDDGGGQLGLSSIGGACFSNLRVSDQATYSRERIPSPTLAQSGTVSEWLLSPASIFEGFPARAPSLASAWSLANTERDGLLLISRYRTKEVRKGENPLAGHVVYAATSLKSAARQRAELDFDASDKVRLYLNGEPLAEIDNTFRAKGPTFRGDFGAERQRVFLDLQEGENELVLAVADAGNGWGLKARIVSEEPVEVRSYPQKE